MNWVTGILVFVVLWWLVFFMTLPFGVRTAEESGENADPGMARSAPQQPRLWLKAGVTTLIAAALWGLCFWLLAYDPFGLGLAIRS